MNHQPSRPLVAVESCAMTMTIRPGLVVLLALLGVGAAAEVPATASQDVDFVRDVRPILAKRCYTCHGPEKHKGGLRLDRKAEALAGGDSGPPFEAGKSAESLLIEKVASDDPELVMPPEGERLTDQEIALLRAWIDQGASWPDGADTSEGAVKPAHWSFVAPARAAPPDVNDRAWARNPIDRFILAKLESEGIAPSPEAGRATLIRRLSIDLTGLLPTPEEVQGFQADPRADAYERLVDRLLASPHFGERWGRHWLDLARYADSDGYEKDSPRPFAYRYRDWVIDAVNRDLPFDQFTIEQLAGDLLPDASLSQKIATGFHRNTLTNREGGVDQEEFRVAAVVDRVNTTGTVWLGLTVGCAQCHTHKYDPILQREYYGLFAFFNSSQEIDLPAPRADEQAAYERAKAAFEAEHAPLIEALKRDDREARPRRQAEWEKSVPPASESWEVLTPAAAESYSGATLAIQPDGSVLASGRRGDADHYTITATTRLEKITAFRLEMLPDKSLPGKGPGRADNGNFVLSELIVEATPLGADPGRGERVPLQSPTAGFSQDGFAVAAAIDGDEHTGWAVAPRLGRDHVAVFETRRDVGSAEGTRLVFTLVQHHGERHTIGRFRISAIAAPRPITADRVPDDVVMAVSTPPECRSAEESKRVAAYHRKIDPEYQRLALAVEEHARKAPKPPDSKAPTLAEAEKPRTTHVLIRGDFLRPGEEVRPGTPAALPPMASSDAPPNRLDLARWLVDPANPLTARVEVNRIWRNLFGRPIVASVDDFGTRGEKPSHPELLDWLATEFPARGWSRKAMIRLIVTSAAYRQSSRVRPELIDRDPNNTWLARQNRFRPEAEVVRDLFLSASGLLADRIGGPSVRPPQPPGISELTYAGSAKWVESQGADRYRRGLYTWFQRTSPYPMLLTFDAPESNVCAVKRERSNTPLQALTLLNDQAFVEFAQGLAARILRRHPTATFDERLRHAFQVCLGREPDGDERRTLGSLYHGLRAQPLSDAEAAKLAGMAAVEGSPPREAAAWVALARVILNLDEFVTRE
jgi:mono/diheme cytochrome c family protein